MPSSLNDQSSDRASLLAPALAGGTLDSALVALHASIGSVARALNTIAPFPTDIPCPGDASISETTLGFGADGRVHVQASYTTDLALSDLAALHQDRFTASGVALEEPVSPASNLAVVRGSVDGSATATRIRVDDHTDNRRVRLDVDYHGFDPAAVFERAANWHLDAAPVEPAPIDGFEIHSMQNRFRPMITAIYSTRYRVADTDRSVLRPLIEHRLHEAGWSWQEPEADILFLTGAFDAETHMRQDGADTLVTFVGVFEVPTDA